MSIRRSIGISEGDGWKHYTLAGLRELPMDAPVCHVSLYEAAAFAEWKGMRLADRVRMGSRERAIRLGNALGMDEQRVSSISGFHKSCRCGRRIQRQIHDQPDGPARCDRGDARGSQPADIQKLF